VGASGSGGEVTFTLSELLEELAEPRRRYPVTRTGARSPIPSVVRVSVLRRDGAACRECGYGAHPHGRGMQLDHMLPWSAGGGDHSGNLRTLCARCNQRRSNWNDGVDGYRVIPTSWWCFDCWRRPDLDDPAIDYCGDDIEPQRVFRPPWRNGVDLNRAPYVTEPQCQVYCAWCWGYGWSDVLFDEQQQARLANLCDSTATDHRTNPSAESATETEETR
jgi:hypothetical protein